MAIKYKWLADQLTGFRSCPGQISYRAGSGRALPCEPPDRALRLKASGRKRHYKKSAGKRHLLNRKAGGPGQKPDPADSP